MFCGEYMKYDSRWTGSRASCRGLGIGFTVLDARLRLQDCLAYTGSKYVPTSWFHTHRLPRFAARKCRFHWPAQGICMPGDGRQSQKKLEFWMFMQPSQHFGFALFRRLKHPHPRTEAAGRRAWMRLCWK